jgi:hypothetical protein
MRTGLCIILLSCLLAACHKDNVGVSNELKGQWHWKSSCGGVVGCVYASDTDTHTLSITESTIEISDNGDITFSKAYQVKKVISADNSKSYEIEFSDGTTWTGVVSDNHLTTEFATVIFSVYERQK